MTQTVAFNHEAYGTHARVSAVADWLEILSFGRGVPVRLAEVQDWIDDSGLNHQLAVHFDVIGTPRQVPGPAEATGYVFDVLAQRADVLGEGYPFEIDGSQLCALQHQPPHHGYLYLLGLTTAHAYGLATTAAAAETFERSLGKVMASRGMLATTLREHWSGSGGFEGALRSAAYAVNLTPAPSGAPVQVSVSAVDEGLDVVSHADWADRRVGRWTFIGQATVAKSDRWAEKASEPRPTQWMKLFQEQIRPQPFLAVPHHIQDDHWKKLLDREALLVDRLRLAPLIGDLAPDERRFAEVVASVQPESLRP